MGKTVELEVRNLTKPKEGREYPLPGGYAVAPGETVNVLARPLQVKELRANKFLQVKEVAVHEDSSPKIHLKEAERDLDAAADRLQEAEADVFEAKAPVAAAHRQKLSRALSRAEGRVQKAQVERDAVRDELAKVDDPFSLRRKAISARQEAAKLEASRPSTR